MHIARIYEIAGRDGCNIFDKLSNADFKSVRSAMDNMKEQTLVYGLQNAPA